MRLNEEISRMKSIMGLIMEQSQKKVSIQGVQPVNNTDWDLVHGILGSKRIDDDLEKRVGDELSRGDYRVISVNVKSYKSGSKIITDAEAILQPVSSGQLPHKYFTTRGSIGDSFEQRHDTQVSGLEDRLKNHYKGNVEMFGPYIYSVGGTGVKYKQSFFAIEGRSTNTGGGNSNTVARQISYGDDPNELRQKLKDLSKQTPLYDVDVIIDDTNKILNISSADSSGQRIYLSYIYSDRGELQDVFNKVQSQNNVIKYHNLDMRGGNIKGYVIHIAQ